ncbi:MAG: hypothetical protein U5K55_10330 [Aliarcobacter sp.]|nr:hypothetical protein [Aliarcobacter sp.]
MHILDEEKEYNFEPLYIRILNSNTHEKIIETSNFPKDIKYNEKLLKELKENTISFEEQNNYLISRIKIDYSSTQKVIIEVITTKDMLGANLENLLYILSFIVPIILIFSVIDGNFLIYKSFAPIEKNL